MPTYPFKCAVCGNCQDFVHTMAERDSLHQCSNCATQMQRIPAAGMMVEWKGRWRDQWRNKEGYQDGLGPYGE